MSYTTEKIVRSVVFGLLSGFIALTGGLLADHFHLSSMDSYIVGMIVGFIICALPNPLR